MSGAAFPRLSRRRMLRMCVALVATSFPCSARAQQRIPIADMHSHFGMISRRVANSGLAEDLRSQGVALIAWKLIADSRWTRRTNTGIEQVSDPAPGDLARHFDGALKRMKAYVAAQKLRTVLTRADVDACVAGDAGVVLASEGADFLEGHVENLDSAFEQGLRHLQLVHYIRTPVGDFQTIAPVHNGLSAMGKRLVEACNAKGVLIDVAHSTGPALDQVLEMARAPVVWSHGWVDAQEGDWRDRYGFLQRRLSVAQAKKIAARGGVVGLWGLGLSRFDGRWPVLAGDRQAYTRELVKLIDKIGPDHVAFGTDIEGVGPNWTLNDYGHVRSVVDALQDMKLPASVIERVAYSNYARVLKSALAT